ncbi:hypothetical protein Nans01_08390 [Nocardiopsis ansamitocini]|uniref:Uncharacterized protein n=1 Tax=Nocardiopsis ansamitocini TaxID=1670832 RepID=A0A9W6UHL4_9ACTN|nr:hypothetical protein Nans01_08390 [Nocardiopsis ansamitocini]
MHSGNGNHCHRTHDSWITRAPTVSVTPERLLGKNAFVGKDGSGKNAPSLLLTRSLSGIGVPAATAGTESARGKPLPGVSRLRANRPRPFPLPAAPGLGPEKPLGPARPQKNLWAIGLGPFAREPGSRQAGAPIRGPPGASRPQSGHRRQQVRPPAHAARAAPEHRLFGRCHEGGPVSRVEIGGRPQDKDAATPE